MIEIGHASHPGKVRVLNEDSYDIDLGAGVAVVVDGMGGPNAGDIASAFIRGELHKNLVQGEAPVTALANAGNALRQQHPGQSGKPSGAGAIAAVWNDMLIELAWLGSCRAWLFDGMQVVRIDAPSTDAGQQTAAGNPPIQALGVTAPDRLSISSSKLPWQRGQSVLLCSDSLLEECPVADLHRVLADTDISAQEAADRLLLNALQGNAANNLTAVLLRRV